MSVTRNPVMSGAERFAWTAFAVGAVVGVVGVLFFIYETQAYAGSPEVALPWAVLGLGLAGATIAPALILAGVRQMAESLLPLRPAAHEGEPGREDHAES